MTMSVVACWTSTCIAEAGGIGDVIRCMKGCNRSQPHVDLLRHANATLAHVARYQQLHQALLASSDCVQVIAEQLQMFRDREVCLHPADVLLPCMACYSHKSHCDFPERRH